MVSGGGQVKEIIKLYFGAMPLQARSHTKKAGSTVAETVKLLKGNQSESVQSSKPPNACSFLSRIGIVSACGSPLGTV